MIVVCSGSYQPNQLSSACVPCPPATFASSQGLSACVSCPAGLIAPHAGSTSCVRSTSSPLFTRSSVFAQKSCPQGASTATGVSCECAGGFYSTNSTAKGLQCWPCPSEGACYGGLVYAPEGAIVLRAYVELFLKLLFARFSVRPQISSFAGSWAFVDPSDPSQSAQVLPCRPGVCLANRQCGANRRVISRSACFAVFNIVIGFCRTTAPICSAVIPRLALGNVEFETWQVNA